MRKADVLAHFDNSPIAVARAIHVTRSAVNQWGDLVPLDKALRIQAATQGQLQVDLRDYEVADLSVRNDSSKPRQITAS